MKKVLSLLFFFVFALPSYSIDFSRFDINDVNSIAKATKAYQKEYNHKHATKEAEQDFLKFLEFYYKAIEIQAKEISFEYKSYKSSFEKQAQEYSKKYYPKGMIIHFDEGDFFLVPSNRYLYDKFSPYLTEDWKELLKYEVYFDKRIISDGRYIISKNEIENIISFYKYFYKKYPKYIKSQDIKENIEKYENDLKHYPNLFY